MSLDRMNISDKKSSGITFEELLSRETYDAFIGYLKVSDAKNKGIIPESYHNIFPDKCKCGSDMIVTGELTQILCCNPRCYIKLGHMLDEMFTRFGIKGFGPATCVSAMQEAVNYLEVPSHVEIFNLDRFDLPVSILNYKYSEFMETKEIMLSKQYTLSDLIPKLGLPGLGQSAQDIFEEFDDILEVETALDAEGGIVRFLANRGVYSSMTAFYLRTYLPDIIVAQMFFNEQIRMQAGQVIEIVMTGYLSPNGNSMSKDEYLELLNKTGTTKDGVPLYGFRKSSAVKSVPYIVADYPSSSKKYREGVARGVIISSTELLEKVKSLVKGAEESEQ